MPTEIPQGDEDPTDGASRRAIDPDYAASVHQEFQTWSRGQEEAYLQLVEVADAFFETDWGATGLRPRLDSLIVGPSGTGKSHIIRMVSRKLSIPYLRLSFSEWIPMGARERPPTMQRLHAFITENSQGMIHIDEIDKFRGSNTGEWSTSIFTELFLLLDRSVEQPSQNFQWLGHLRKKLSTSFLILGSGTWQSIWDQGGSTKIGFQTGQHFSQSTPYEEIQKSNVIPKELLRRFNSELIVMPAPREEDYRNAAQFYGLPKLAEQVGVALDYVRAAESGLGARWLEETLAHLLRAAKRTGKPLFPRRGPIVPSEPDPEDSPASDCPF